MGRRGVATAWGGDRRGQEVQGPIPTCSAALCCAAPAGLPASRRLAAQRRRLPSSGVLPGLAERGAHVLKGEESHRVGGHGAQQAGREAAPERGPAVRAVQARAAVPDAAETIRRKHVFGLQLGLDDIHGVDGHPEGGAADASCRHEGGGTQLVLRHALRPRQARLERLVHPKVGCGKVVWGEVGWGGLGWSGVDRVGVGQGRQ